jgi:hypothetical protein
MTSENPTIGHGADEPGSGTIVGIIRGDRVCIACGFNLCGQRIVREPRYNLLIARCPECGQAAALQEYPLLGRWANRWAATLAGLWLMGFFALSIGCGMAIFGLAVGTTAINGDAVGNRIAEAHVQWWADTNPTAPSINPWSPINMAWWDGADHGAFFERAGGVSMLLWRSSQTTWLGLLFAMIPIGALASVALLGVSRGRLALASVFPLVVAALVSVVYGRSVVTSASVQSPGADDLAFAMVWPWTIPTTIALGGVFLVIGMLTGRPLARLLARTALPNRFVQALAVLWTSEGLDPPGPRR